MPDGTGARPPRPPAAPTELEIAKAQRNNLSAQLCDMEIAFTVRVAALEAELTELKQRLNIAAE